MISSVPLFSYSGQTLDTILRPWYHFGTTRTSTSLWRKLEDTTDIQKQRTVQYLYWGCGCIELLSIPDKYFHECDKLRRDGVGVLSKLHRISFYSPQIATISTTNPFHVRTGDIIKTSSSSTPPRTLYFLHPISLLKKWPCLKMDGYDRFPAEKVLSAMVSEQNPKSQ